MQNLSVFTALSICNMLLATSALSMTLTNKDAEARQITITENGSRSTRELAAGESVQICENGCFITFPDGTLTAYQGNEIIIIRKGGPALAE